MKLHGKTNKQISENLEKFPDYVIECNLAEILANRGITQKEFSLLTGVPVGALSEFSNLKRSTINLTHLLVIIQTLRLTDISELFKIKVPESLRDQIDQDQKDIDFYGKLPEQDEYLRLLRENKKASV